MYGVRNRRDNVLYSRKVAASPTLRLAPACIQFPTHIALSLHHGTIEILSVENMRNKGLPNQVRIIIVQLMHSTLPALPASIPPTPTTGLNNVL